MRDYVGRFEARRCARVLLVTPLVLALGLAGARSSDANEGLNERQSRALAQVCAQCHLTPGLGAPMPGDETEWAPRREKGFDALVRNTVLGLGNMPPLGTCGFCSEADFRALVSFLSGMPDEGGEEGG